MATDFETVIENLVRTGGVQPMARIVILNAHRAEKAAQQRSAPLADIGQRIRTARDEKGLTQAALATAIGTSQPIVSAIEKVTRQTTGSQLSALTRVLGVSADWILGIEPGAPQAPEETDRG